MEGEQTLKSQVCETIIWGICFNIVILQILHDVTMGFNTGSVTWTKVNLQHRR